MSQCPRKIIVAGIGTDVGKTLVAAILTHALNADYWKPVQCGLPCDKDTVYHLLPASNRHDEALFLKYPLSPHHAAKLEGFTIDPRQIEFPKTTRPLIIECAGGLLVPLTTDTLTVDVFARWDAEWVVVSRHYLGSINHTLLTIEAMKKRALNIRGIVFNGNPNPETEKAILAFTQLPCIGRLKQEKQCGPQQIQKYAQAWKKNKAFQSAMRM